MRDFDYQRDNDILRGALARSGQQIEWLSRENTVLRRNNAELISELMKLAAQLNAACGDRDRNSLRIVELENKLDQCERDGERLRNEIKALKGRPGTMSIGPGGVYVFSVGTPPQEVLDAAESLRADHFRNMEDEWYSCPKSGECWRDLPDDWCTCGADDANVAVDKVLAYLKGEAT